jgi:hypothetical protein
MAYTNAVGLTVTGLVIADGAGAYSGAALGTNGQLLIGNTGSDPAFGSVTGGSHLLVTEGAGTLDIDLTSDVDTTAIHGWNGAILEDPMITVTSDGATITLDLEKNGGGDLTLVFSDGFTTLDCTPAKTVALTAGTDTVPVLNYLYILQSAKTVITKSTTAFPSAEHVPIATVLCQSAASLQTDGAYKVHQWSDHLINSSDQGHISHLNAWIRTQNATWKSGVTQTFSITPNGGAADNVIITTTSGVVLQLHDHTFPAFAGTPDLYVVNDNATAYNKVTDMNALLTDSTGASMSGKYFSLVLWGVVNEDTGDCKLMVNLPGGSYNSANGVTADSSMFADFSIPSAFKGTGFLIAQWNLRHQAAASGTWTSIDEIDLRGFFPNVSGGVSAVTSEFIDSAFRILDDADNTKEIAFQASTVSTATTRTITMDDADVDLSPNDGTFAAAAGGTQIVTVGTIATGVWEGTDVGVQHGGTGVSTLTDGGVLLGSGTGAITPLAQATNGQLVVGSTSADPVLATLTGTADQVVVTNGAGSITLSTPQSINTTSSPTFAQLNVDNLRLDGAVLSYGGTGGLTFASDGSFTATTQPWVLATIAAAANVTGDGSSYTLTTGSEIKDIGSDFASNTYTAPVTGCHELHGNVTIEGIVAAHTYGIITIVTSNRNYAGYELMDDSAGGFESINMTALADMDAADTCTFTVNVLGSTKVVDVTEGFMMARLEG